MYESGQFGGTPPPLPPPKSAKKRFLQAPLAAIKNALRKSTKPLRRQNSERFESKERPRVSNLRRQHSMMEHRPPAWAMRSPEFGHRGEQRYYPDHPDDNMYEQQRFNYMRHEPYYQQHPGGESNYANYGGHGHDDYVHISRPGQSGHFIEENLYANRALIELEKHAMASQHGPEYGADRSASQTSGGRIVRRHSMADRSASRESPLIVPGRNPRGRYISRDSSFVGDAPSSLMETSQREEIYQTRSGAYMMTEQRVPRVTNRTGDEEAIYQSRREMHRDHLYQSKKEMQQRIHQGRMEVERAASSESPSIPSSAATTPTIAESNASPIRDTIYQSRKELKERGFKTRTQLRDHIYQSRREAMESMAEPIYVSTKQRQELANLSEGSIHETVDAVESAQAILPLSSVPSALTNTTTVFANQNSRNSSGSADMTNDEETITPMNHSDLHKTKVSDTVECADVTKLTMSPRADRSHISNIIKRIAPQPPLRSPTTACESSNAAAENCAAAAAQIHASRTSMETQYTSSQLSLPTGPPAAHSTPYASEAMLDPPHQMVYPPLREPSNMRGLFDEHGGTLRDSIWNVSINIPAGAIAPGTQQEIYFTVTDPRMSQTVGGPPLDCENGWCFLTIFFIFFFFQYLFCFVYLF